MQSWGGFTGMGRGWMSVESRGLMSKVGRCGTTLPAEQRLALETAVANARPEQWQPRYESKLLVTDQMTFVLSFTSDGRQFQTSWTSAAQRDVLPSDLAALSAAIWAAQDAYAAPCRVSSSTSPASKAP